MGTYLGVLRESYLLNTNITGFRRKQLQHIERLSFLFCAMFTTKKHMRKSTTLNNRVHIAQRWTDFYQNHLPLWNQSSHVCSCHFKTLLEVKLTGIFLMMSLLFCSRLLVRVHIEISKQGQHTKIEAQQEFQQSPVGGIVALRKDVVDQIRNEEGELGLKIGNKEHCYKMQYKLIYQFQQ